MKIHDTYIYFEPYPDGTLLQILFLYCSCLARLYLFLWHRFWLGIRPRRCVQWWVKLFSVQPPNRVSTLHYTFLPFEPLGLLQRLLEQLPGRFRVIAHLLKKTVKSPEHAGNVNGFRYLAEGAQVK
jgi:hypothetical protein